MRRDIPDIIREVGFDFDWDEEKVWRLDLPAAEMPLSELEWHFDVPFLWTKGGVYDLVPRKVLEDPAAYPEEYERTMGADLAYPIDVMENKGRLLILDGLHRLMKAYVLGREKVAVRVVPRELIPEILKDGGHNQD